MSEPFIVYVVSGGVGSSGEQVVQTVLAQFPNHNVKLKVIPHVRSLEKVSDIVAQAAETNSPVVHTMVNSKLRESMIRMLAENNVPGFDIMGDLLSHFSKMLKQQPSGEPGLYRRLHRSYFQRVEAIDYTLEHDDGIDPAGWGQAHALLVGPSRTGKTPISMYLAVLGWRIANYPIVPGINIPQKLKTIEPLKVIGLTIDPVRLVAHRTTRQKRLGTLDVNTDYTDLEKVYAEIEEAQEFYRRHNYRRIDVTDKPIEACADEIVHLIPERF